MILKKLIGLVPIAEMRRIAMEFIVKIFWNENERRIRALWRLVLQIVLLVIIMLVLQYVVLFVTALVGLASQTITLAQLDIKALKGAFRSFSRNHYDVPILAHEFVSTLVGVWLVGTACHWRGCVGLPVDHAVGASAVWASWVAHIHRRGPKKSCKARHRNVKWRPSSRQSSTTKKRRQNN
jgi:hypothetical protein